MTNNNAAPKTTEEAAAAISIHDSMDSDAELRQNKRETDPKRTCQDDAIENAFHNDRSERSETVHAEQAARILGSEQFTDTTPVIGSSRRTP